MGHVRLGPLPRTRRWVHVVALIRGGAAAAEVSTAAAHAAENWLSKAANDPTVVEAVWLLLRLPHAARADDFPAALARLGVAVPAPPGLVGLVGAVSAAIDAAAPPGRRTDLGEMAQAAAAEALTGVVGPRLPALFGADPEDVQREVGRLATVKQFGILARDFFARLGHRVLDYFLSKATPAEVGDGKRFRTTAAHAAFAAALDTHCREAAAVLERYAGEWLSKHHYETGGDIPKSGAAAFTAYAMTKLSGELRRRDADAA